MSDIENITNNLLQEHNHDGANSQKVSFNNLKDLPDFVYNPLQEDLDLNGHTITGKTLITGQTEITSLEATDEFIISDASDGDALKRVERQYFGNYSTAAGTNAVYTSSAGLYTLDLTFLFSGIVRLTFIVSASAYTRFSYFLPGEDISSHADRLVFTTAGTSLPSSDTISAGTYNYDIFIYAGTRIKATTTFGGGTFQLIAKYDKTLRTAPYAS